MIFIAELKLEDAYKIRDIDRSEKINKIYRCREGVLQEVPSEHDCPNWDVENYRELINRYENELTNGGTAYGAFAGETLVGFGVLASKFRGTEKDQLQIDLMYVTREYRRQGIGRQIMEHLSRAAIARGARYLYISSTETESAVKFYSSCGSTPTAEVDEELFEKEPDDIHMLIKLS